MMNRVGLGLAVGAGYVLGRTKKLKFAIAIGSMVAGKRLNPRALAGLASQQLRDNPQFKELGDQLRGELRGVGKAATGALVERQIEGLADRLHGRTEKVRDQVAGVAPDLRGRGEGDRDDDGYADEEEQDETPHDEHEDEHDEGADVRSAENDEAAEEEPEPPRRKAAEKAPDGKTAAPAARGTVAKKAAAKKAPAKKATAKKSAAGKTAPARKTARKTSRSRATRGSGGDD